MWILVAPPLLCAWIWHSTTETSHGTRTPQTNWQREIVPSHTQAANGNWSWTMGSSKNKPPLQNTISNCVSSELVCDSFYRDTHHGQYVINSYFLSDWIFSWSTTPRLHFRTNSGKLWPSTSLISVAWRLGNWRSAIFILFPQPFLGNIMIEAGRRKKPKAAQGLGQATTKQNWNYKDTCCSGKTTYYWLSESHMEK